MTNGVAIAFMVAAAAGFAVFMSWRRPSREPLRFTTFLLQGFMCEGAIVLFASFFHPALVDGATRNALIAVMSMMTLIYAMRDVFDTIRHK